MKICLNGVPGVGKSTIAHYLAKALSLPHHTEIFNNNPYLTSGPDWRATQFQLNTSYRQFKANNKGVFEVSPLVSINIFTPAKDHGKIRFMTEKYDYEFYLNASYRTIKNRILSRNRPGLVDTELAELPVRLGRYNNFIDNNVPTKQIIDANGSLAEILSEILSSFTIDIHK